MGTNDSKVTNPRPEINKEDEFRTSELTLININGGLCGVQANSAQNRAKVVHLNTISTSNKKVELLLKIYCK
jgi:hypothetical protein